MHHKSNKAAIIDCLFFESHDYSLYAIAKQISQLKRFTPKWDEFNYLIDFTIVF